MRFERGAVVLEVASLPTRKTSTGEDWMPAGLSYFFFAVIRKQYVDDRGLLEHELEHVRQWWFITLRGLLLLAVVMFIVAVNAGTNAAVQLGAFSAPLVLVLEEVAYALSSAYRFSSEVAAYRVQAQFYPDDRRPLFAQYIASLYQVPFTNEQALIKLTK